MAQEKSATVKRSIKPLTFTVQVTVNGDNTSGTVIRYGLETDVNTPAVIGVPEANSLACLAMGAAGLVGWRQRRKSA